MAKFSKTLFWLVEHGDSSQAVNTFDAALKGRLSLKKLNLKIKHPQFTEFGIRSQIKSLLSRTETGRNKK